jgi:hypothetical protein
MGRIRDIVFSPHKWDDFEDIYEYFVVINRKDIGSSFKIGDTISIHRRQKVPMYWVSGKNKLKVPVDFYIENVLNCIRELTPDELMIKDIIE